MLFAQVIKKLSGKRIVPFVRGEPQNESVIEHLEGAMAAIPTRVSVSRVNEASNLLENLVMRAINDQTPLEAERPLTRRGKGKSAGYPDILLTDRQGRKLYLEIKAASFETINSPLRSFFLSPSAEFKVIHDAPHLLLSFVLKEVGREKKVTSYQAVAYKLLTLENVECVLKQEYNSSNAKLYNSKNVLAEGRIG